MSNEIMTVVPIIRAAVFQEAEPSAVDKILESEEKNLKASLERVNKTS